MINQDLGGIAACAGGCFWALENGRVQLVPWRSCQCWGEEALLGDAGGKRGVLGEGAGPFLAR